MAVCLSPGDAKFATACVDGTIKVTCQKRAPALADGCTGLFCLVRTEVDPVVSQRCICMASWVKQKLSLCILTVTF